MASRPRTKCHMEAGTREPSACPPGVLRGGLLGFDLGLPGAPLCWKGPVFLLEPESPSLRSLQGHSGASDFWLNLNLVQIMDLIDLT